MKIIDGKEYLNLGEAAKYTELSRMTLGLRLNQLGIKRKRYGNERLVAKDDLEGVMEPIESPTTTNIGVSTALLSDPRLSQEDSLILAECIRLGILSMHRTEELKIVIDLLCLEKRSDEENAGDLIRSALKSWIDKALQKTEKNEEKQ